MGLAWVAGKKGSSRHFESEQTKSSKPVAGYLNLVRPNQIQLIGPEEHHYITTLKKNSHQDAIKRLFDSAPRMIIFTDCEEVDKDFITLSDQTETPLLQSSLSADKLLELLVYHLRRLLGDSKIMHGVFMEVMGIGVLLTGPSGIGKSELALELLSNGHRLVADDAPEFRRSAPGTIRGTCPAVLKDFLEVRGLGILNVRAMFGDNAVVETKRLRLIVHLEKMEDDIAWKIDRLDSTQRKIPILDVDIPEVIIPVGPGRNVAIIIEAAVRNHVLFLNGYNAAEDFIQRQQKLINIKQ